MKLYEIADNLLQAISQTDENGELLPGIEERLDALQMDLQEKAHGICCVVRNKAAEAEAFKAEADRLAKHAETLEREVKSMKDYLKFNMERTGVTKLETPLFKIAIQNNSQPSVILAEGADVPPGFARVKIELDSRAAIIAHRAGQSLPACLSVVTGNHLRIR